MRTITISGNKNRTDKVLLSKDSFFRDKEFVVISQTHEKISIQEACLDDRKPLKIGGMTDGWVRIYFKNNEAVENGKYLIDEDESSQDAIVVYFEDIIE